MHVWNQPARQHQIDHGEQRVQLRGVLRHAVVAGLAVPKQVLHDVERVLDLGTDAGLDLLDRLELLCRAEPGRMTTCQFTGAPRLSSRSAAPW